ncbi:MAG: NUDIX domain-containing protein [Candidatus Paceibacterota bacterium]
MPDQKRDWHTFAHTPVGKEYAVSVQTILWNSQGTHVCFVLDQGGIKTRRGVSHQKPRGYGNPGGAVSEGETPYERAIHETEQETNHMRHTFRINPNPVDVVRIGNSQTNEGRTRYKVVFIGKIVNPHEPLTDGPVKDPAGGIDSGVIYRRWVAYNDLPGMEEVRKPGYLFFGEPIYVSHLGYVFSHKPEEV